MPGQGIRLHAQPVPTAPVALQQTLILQSGDGDPDMIGGESKIAADLRQGRNRCSGIFPGALQEAENEPFGCDGWFHITNFPTNIIKCNITDIG